MLEFFKDRDGGGCYIDLYRPKDQRHLTDHVNECLTAEMPYADAERSAALARKVAREEFVKATSSGLGYGPYPRPACDHLHGLADNDLTRRKGEGTREKRSQSALLARNPSSYVAAETFVRIEGGRPVTYYGDQARGLAARAAGCVGMAIPRPPPALPRHVEDEGILIDKEQAPRPSGRRRVRPPTAPPTVGHHHDMASNKDDGGGDDSILCLGIAGIGADRAEIRIGTGGPRKLHRVYNSSFGEKAHTLSSGGVISTGGGGAASSTPLRGQGQGLADIIFYDQSASRIPTKTERIRVMKATLPNADEEAAQARMERTRSASPRLPAACSSTNLGAVAREGWRRPNYPYAWMREEARKDDMVYNSALRQKKERQQRREQAQVNFNADYAKLRGAALSVSSPRYLMESARRAEAVKEAQREERLDKLWAATEQRYIAERAERERAEGPPPSMGEGKKLSSKMRREIMAVYERVGLSPR